MVMNTVCIYHFVDPKLVVEIFCEKETATEKCVDFEMGLTHLLHTCIWVEENFM